MSGESPERGAVDWEARFAEGTTPWERGQMHPAFLDWKAAGAFRDIDSVVIPGCGRAPEVAVAGGGGSWRYQPSPRHAQILALLADGARREALGEAARAKAGRFSWTATGDAVERLLSDVAAGRMRSGDVGPGAQASES